MRLRGMSEADAAARIASQVPDEARLAIADVVIDTAGSLEDTDRQVDDLWDSARGAHRGPRAYAVTTDRGGSPMSFLSRFRRRKEPYAALADEERIARYVYLLNTLPSAVIESAHAKAFEDVPPERRREMFEQLKPFMSDDRAGCGIR